MVAEQTTACTRPEQIVPVFPAILVPGAERGGVSPEVVEAADAAVAIPMLGMANSLNVAPPRQCGFGVADSLGRQRRI